MKITVDQVRCQINGICVKELPEVFRFQIGSKKAVVDCDEIPPALEKKCIEIARKCPVHTISIEE